MANKDIRAEIKASGLKMWEVAYHLGMGDGNFSKKLRLELSDEDKQRIRHAMSELITNREQGDIPEGM